MSTNRCSKWLYLWWLIWNICIDRNSKDNNNGYWAIEYVLEMFVFVEIVKIVIMQIFHIEYLQQMFVFIEILKKIIMEILAQLLCASNVCIDRNFKENSYGAIAHWVYASNVDIDRYFKDNNNGHLKRGHLKKETNVFYLNMLYWLICNVIDFMYLLSVYCLFCLVI